MLINLVALAAFFLLGLNKRCRHYAHTLALCFFVQLVTNYETVNLLTPNEPLPVELVQVLLMGYFFVSISCQGYIIQALRFRTQCALIVSTLSCFALLNDIIGLLLFYSWLDLDGYELRSRLIIAAQFIAIWTLAGHDRSRNLHVLYDWLVRFLDSVRDFKGNKRG